jgi:putative membrane protein
MGDANPDSPKPGPAETAPAADSRLRLGLETTLLAWVRTGLALMGFGFVLARFGLFLREFEESQHITPRQVQASLTFGVTLIGAGVVVNLMAAWMHYPFMYRFRKNETDLPSTWKLGLLLALLTVFVGIAMTVLLIFV